MTRTIRAMVATVAAAALALAGCDSDDGGSAALEGNVLQAGDIWVSYPDGWTEVDPGDTLDAVAELSDPDDHPIGRISILRGFTDTHDIAFASGDAASLYIFGGRADWSGEIDLDGVDGEVWRNDYPEQESPGGDDTMAPEGAMISGTDVVAFDSDEVAFFVRINYLTGELTDDELDDIVNSVTVTTG